MSENQGRSIWDVFSDVKPDSFGTGLNQPPASPTRTEQVSPGPPADKTLDDASTRPAGKNPKKKSERTPDPVKRKSAVDGLSSATSRPVISSLKLTAIRNKLKLSNGTGLNKSPQKPKHNTRQRRNSVTPSPTRKSPKGKTPTRKNTSPDNLVGVADLQPSFSDILTRTISPDTETSGNKRTKRKLVPLPAESTEVTDKLRNNSVTEDQETDESSPNTLLTGALKVSKREKRRPVKYSPELSRPISTKAKNKTPDLNKDTKLSKTRRRVDFSDKLGSEDKTKETGETNKSPGLEPTKCHLTGTPELRKGGSTGEKGDVNSKQETKARNYHETVQRVKCSVEHDSEETNSCGTSSQETSRGSTVGGDRTPVSRGQSIVCGDSGESVTYSDSGAHSMVVAGEPTRSSQQQASTVQKDTPEASQEGIIATPGQLTVDHQTQPSTESEMTAMPRVLSRTFLENSDIIRHKNISAENVTRTALPSEHRAEHQNGKQTDDGPPKRLPSLLPIPLVGRLLEQPTRARESPPSDCHQADRSRSPFVYSKSRSPPQSTMMVQELRGVDGPAGGLASASSDDCAPLDLSRGKKKGLEFINLDEPLDLSVKRKALNPPAVNAPFYEDPNKDVSIPFSGGSNCNRVAPMIHRTSSQRNIFESRNQSHIRKVSPVRPHIAGKPVVRGASYGPGDYSLPKPTGSTLPSRLLDSATNGSPLCDGVNSKGVMGTAPKYGEFKITKQFQNNHSAPVHDERLRANSPFAQAHAALLSGGSMINTPKESSSSARTRSPASSPLSCSAAAAPVLNVPTYHQRTKEETRKTKKTSEPLRIAIPGDSLYEATRSNSLPTAQVKPNNTMNIVGEVSINLDRAAPATVTIHGGLTGNKSGHSKKTARKSTRGESASNLDKRLLQQMLEGTSPPQLTVVSPPKSATADGDVAAQTPMPSPQMPVLSPHSSQNQSPSGPSAKDYHEPTEKHSPALPSTLAALRKICTASSRETTPMLDCSLNLTQIEKTKFEKARELLNSNSALASLLVTETIKPIGGEEIKQEPPDLGPGSEILAPKLSNDSSPKTRSPKSPKTPKAKPAKCQVAKELLDKCSYPSAFAPVAKFSRKALQKSRRSFFAGFAFNFKKTEERKRNYDIGKSTYYQCNVLGKQTKDISVNDSTDTKVDSSASSVNPYSKVSYFVPEKGDDYVPSFNLPFTDWRDHLYKYKRQRLKMPNKLVYVPSKGNTPKKFEDFTTLISATPTQGCSSKRRLSAVQLAENENLNSQILTAIKQEVPQTRKFGVIVERRPWLLEEGELARTEDKAGRKLKRKSETSTDSSPVKRGKSAEKQISPDGEKPRIFLKIANGKIISSYTSDNSCEEHKDTCQTPTAPPAESPSKKGVRGPYKQRYSRVRLEETYPQHLDELKTFRVGEDSGDGEAELTSEQGPPPLEVLVTLKDAMLAVESLRLDLITQPAPTSSESPCRLSGQGNIAPGDSANEARGKLGSSPGKLEVDDALANLVRRVKSQILGRASNELNQKKTPVKNSPSLVGTAKKKLTSCTVLLTRDKVPETTQSHQSSMCAKEDVNKVTKEQPSSSSISKSHKKLTKAITQKKTNVYPARKDKERVSPLKSSPDRKKSLMNSRKNSPVKSTCSASRQILRSPRRREMDKVSSRSPTRCRWKSPRKRAAEAAKARKSKRRSMLDELANSEGYVADKQMKKGGENLYADPSKLGREERALQRALMQFSEMQLKNELGKDKKRKLKAPPPPHSQARQKARQLKKKAMQGSKNKAAMSRPTRRPIEFRPQRPTTRLQAAVVDGRVKSGRVYHKDDAYERALNKEEQRRRQIRVGKRCKLLQSQSSGSGEGPEGLPESWEGDNEGPVDDDDLPVITPAKKKCQGFIFDWRSKYLGKSPKGKSLKNGKGIKAKCSKRKLVPLEAEAEADPEANSYRVNLGANDTNDRASSEEEEEEEEEYDSDSTVSYDESSSEEESTDEETVQVVVEEKLDIPLEVKKLNICHNTGETILHKAARLGYEDVVLWCSQHNYVDVKARDNAGYSALHESCVPGHLKVARYLLEYGADVNVASRLDGVRPLHDAVENDHTELVRLLLSAGADPTLSTYSGRSILKLARTRDLRQFLQAYLMDLNGPSEMERETIWDFDFVSKDPGRVGGEGAETQGGDAETQDAPECGCDVLGDLPSDDDEDAHLLEFEFSEELPIQSYLLCVDDKKGPENYLVLSDVMARLRVSDGRLCSLHGSLHLEHITWDEFTAQLETSQLPMVPRDDIRPLDGNEMMDFVQLDRKMQDLLGMDIEIVNAQEISGEATRRCAQENYTLNVSICSEDLVGIEDDSLSSPNDSVPPLGSYISRTASGDQSIKRAGPLQLQQEPVYDSVLPTLGMDVMKEATTPEECFSAYQGKPTPGATAEEGFSAQGGKPSPGATVEEGFSAQGDKSCRGATVEEGFSAQGDKSCRGATVDDGFSPQGGKSSPGATVEEGFSCQGKSSPGATETFMD